MCGFDLAQITKGLHYVECECVLLQSCRVVVSLRQVSIIAFEADRYRPASDLRRGGLFSSAMHTHMLCILMGEKTAEFFPQHS